MKTELMDKLVLECLEVGKKKKRYHLVERVREKIFADSETAELERPARLDRAVRRAIARLSKMYPIISNSDGEGYCIARTKEQFESAINEHYSRAMASLTRVSRLKKQAAEYGINLLPGFESLEEKILEMEKMK
jgi:hypothetical protein